MITIIDYGVGNLFSLISSFRAVGCEVDVTGEIEKIKKADKIVLPGVGAFRDARRKLAETGLDQVVIDKAASGTPLLGVCLGMQLLFEKSYEYGEWDGLGLLKGEIRPISDFVPADLKIPHMGWNALQFTDNRSRLFENVKEGEHVYFVHSYSAVHCDDSVAAVVDYGGTVTASVAKGNVFGCQFHPEKSGTVGLRMLKAYAEL